MFKVTNCDLKRRLRKTFEIYAVCFYWIRSGNVKQCASFANRHSDKYQYYAGVCWVTRTNECLSKNALHIENLRLELQNQRAYIEEILRDQNDTNELIQSLLDALSDSMAELSLKMDSITQSESKSRPPIGFAIPRQNSNEWLLCEIKNSPRKVWQT